MGRKSHHLKGTFKYFAGNRRVIFFHQCNSSPLLPPYNYLNHRVVANAHKESRYGERGQIHFPVVGGCRLHFFLADQLALPDRLDIFSPEPP